MGSMSERLVLQFLELFGQPYGVCSLTTFFEMSKKKENVVPGSKMVLLTPAQQKLVDQCNQVDAFIMQAALLHCYSITVHYVEENEVKDLYLANDVLNLRETLLQLAYERHYTPPAM